MKFVNLGIASAFVINTKQRALRYFRLNKAAHAELWANISDHQRDTITGLCGDLAFKVCKVFCLHREGVPVWLNFNYRTSKVAP